jgi:hypothetical protein
MTLLKSSGLFVVNQDDVNYAISTEILKDYIAPLAKQETGDPNDPGHPGLVMPGEGFIYDESTGKLDVNIPSGIQYVGLIGTNPLNDEVLEPDSYHSPGDFYIVVETLELCNDEWPGIDPGSPTGCIEVSTNDKVIMNNDGEWDIIPAITEDFIHVGPTPPSDPSEGNLWWENNISNELYIWLIDAYGNGGWEPVSQGGSQVILSPTEPYYIDENGIEFGEPVETGTLWVDDTTFDMYVWEGDAWVQVSSAGAFVATCILSPDPPYLIDSYGNEDGQKVSKGTLWIDSNTFNMYVWDGDAWAQVSGVGKSDKGSLTIVDPDSPFQPDTNGNETNDDHEVGTIWINSTNNESYYWDGSAWNTIMIDIESLPQMERN